MRCTETTAGAAGIDWEALWRAFSRDHALPELIWNAETRAELQQHLQARPQTYATRARPLSATLVLQQRDVGGPEVTRSLCGHRYCPVRASYDCYYGVGFVQRGFNFN